MMNKSDLFKRAHAIARMTKQFAGSYRIAFSCALKGLLDGTISHDWSKIIDEVTSLLQHFGGRTYIANDMKRTFFYYNECAANVGYADADQIRGSFLMKKQMFGKSIEPEDKAECRFMLWCYLNQGALRDRLTWTSTNRIEDPEDILSIGGGERAYARYCEAHPNY